MVDYGWGPVTGEASAATQHQPRQRQKTEAAGIMTFVLSLCGVFTWGFSCIAALFLAPGARRNIAVSPETRKGSGLVLAGQIISAVTLLVAALVVVLVFFAT
jgi:hypothetical protein